MPKLVEDRTRTNIQIAKSLGFEPMVMKRNGDPHERTWRWPDKWRGRYGANPHRHLPDFVRMIEEGLQIRDGFRNGFDDLGEDPGFYEKELVPKDRSTGGILPGKTFGSSPEDIITEIYGEDAIYED